jgi:hypothetical protein
MVAVAATEVGNEIGDEICKQTCITFLFYNSACSSLIYLATMSTATLSFRAAPEFAAQTRYLAQQLKLSSSDYVREAVREKNERLLRERMVFLSGRLSALGAAEFAEFETASHDGLNNA